MSFRLIGGWIPYRYTVIRYGIRAYAGTLRDYIVHTHGVLADEPKDEAGEMPSIEGDCAVVRPGIFDDKEPTKGS